MRHDSFNLCREMNNNQIDQSLNDSVDFDSLITRPLNEFPMKWKLVHFDDESNTIMAYSTECGVGQMSLISLVLFGLSSWYYYLCFEFWIWTFCRNITSNDPYILVFSNHSCLFHWTLQISSIIRHLHDTNLTTANKVKQWHTLKYFEFCSKS